LTKIGDRGINDLIPFSYRSVQKIRRALDILNSHASMTELSTTLEGGELIPEIMDHFLKIDS